MMTVFNDIIVVYTETIYYYTRAWTWFRRIMFVQYDRSVLSNVSSERVPKLTREKHVSE